jgi:hypothetical protein
MMINQQYQVAILLGQSNEGKKLPVGTYFYHMIYDDNLQKTGWVYLNY